MRCPGRYLVSVAAAFLAPHVLLGDQQTSEAAQAFSPKATQNDRHLAVVVPVHDGDVSRALSSLASWPDVCSPVTLANMDLVIYKAETAEKSSAEILATAEETAGRCFARTKIVHANLPPEDNVYPKGPSEQFYKLFLDEEVRQHFVTYDALVILEWDVMVAHDSSFDQLYHATFGATESFWVKGSVLEGTSFHGIAQMKDMWHVMGHINGNAIYNNTDPYFVEYVEYTLARWEYEYAYDVALWATISNFPYSWPLWQRYASKFVATDLIANVGYNNVDAKAVSSAIAGDTLFIHGKSVEGASGNIRDVAHVDIEEAIEPDVSCEADCGMEHEEFWGMSTVCDASCGKDNRFDGYLCGAGDPLRFGNSCRMCYTDQEAALVAEDDLRLEDPFTSEARHVIMCDTRRPPEAMECSAKCALKTDTVCDPTCGTGRYGDYNCNWRDRGLSCRYCFDDVEAALIADEVARRRGGRVIMCDTHEPPSVGGVEEGELGENDLDERGLGRVGDARREVLLDSKDNEADGDHGREAASVLPKDLPRFDERMRSDPKWRRTMKKSRQRRRSRRLQELCTAGCEIEGTDTGRVCDSTCTNPTSDSYGTRGCGTGNYGYDCRFCYYNLDMALEADRPDYHVIMCDSMEPPTTYTRRRLVGEDPNTLSFDHPAESVDAADVVDKPEAPDAAVSPWRKDERWKDAFLAKGDESKWKRTMKLGKKRTLQSSDSSMSCTEDCEVANTDDGRVCDPTCSNPSSESYGTRGCGVDDYGDDCRYCYYDLSMALAADRPNYHVIMCDTMAPPTTYTRRLSLTGSRAEVYAAAPAETQEDEKLALGDVQTRGDEELDRDTAPRHRDEGSVDAFSASGSGSRWKRNVKSATPRRLETSDSSMSCTEDCEVANTDDGRVCDPTCSNPSSESYGTRGCGVDDYGDDCRYCYYDLSMALAADRPNYHVIMCDTMAPPTTYTARRLAEGEDHDGENRDGDDVKHVLSPEAYESMASVPFGYGLSEGQICVFMGATSKSLGETEMTVRSVRKFMPGMRLAIAVGEEDYGIFQRTFDKVPGLSISTTKNVRVSALLADKHCGDDTELIYYLQPGTLVSRPFSNKDTHSPRGELLVVFTDGRGADFETLARAQAASALLGFRVPIFTYGTDLILPSNANVDLRRLLSMLVPPEGDAADHGAPISTDAELDFLDGELVSVPEVLAAHLYARNPEGVWFLNPQEWVAQHLFKTVSIWDIPLVKPRFSCSLDPHLDVEEYDFREDLSRQLEVFSYGGTCESGVMNIQAPATRLRKPSRRRA